MGILIHKALPKDAYEYAVNHIACWRAAYKGILSDEYLSSMNVEQLAEANQRILSEQWKYIVNQSALWITQPYLELLKTSGFKFDEQ